MRGRNQLVETVPTFGKIADNLLRVPGRKTLLWITSGIPMTINGAYYGPFLEPALGKLDTSDTAIYAIGAVGFDFGPPSDSLVKFAQRTGSKTFYLNNLNNDLTVSMRTALEDMNVSYVTRW
jgi:hypothetical protein